MGGDLRQRTGVEPRRVERLQDVVAGGGEEARLGKVRLLRRGLGAGEFAVEPFELGGALAHAALQPLVGCGEVFFGQRRLGDVGVGGDDAAVGQARRADLQHPERRMEPEADRLLVIEQALEPLGDEIVGAPWAVGAARGVEADDLVEADADPHHRRRQGEQIGEFAVPGGEREIVVEDGDALARVVEGVLQLVAARLDRRRRVVEQLQRRLARHGATAQQQRQHQTRGRGADRRRQQVLGVADQMRVGFFGRREVEPTVALEALERAPRPLGAEIARHRRLELAGRRRGAPQPERLRLAARRGADERGRLHAFERRRLARQRGDEEGEHVEAERQNDAADQRIGRRSRSAPPDAARRSRAARWRGIPTARPRR